MVSFSFRHFFPSYSPFLFIGIIFLNELWGRFTLELPFQTLRLLSSGIPGLKHVLDVLFIWAFQFAFGDPLQPTERNNNRF